MLVNSITFLIFFILFLLPYFSLFRNKVSAQNIWILIASYFFYGWADWRMIPLLFGATVIFYIITLAIAKNNKSSEGLCDNKRRIFLLLTGVLLGIGTLLYFKYTNFLLGPFGVNVNLIVPIGISFFTFKLIAYLVEVNKGNIPVERNFIRFATYIAFFPTIMSGPIDGPKEFLPQLKEKHHWNDEMVLEGCKRILWGLFLKMCVADKISPYTDSVFNNYYHHSGVTIILASVLYTFQIYADFCGYSEMAIGVGRIMGIKVIENFSRPLFATNPGDFWRRWHMSLMAFFREYIYFPLGGSRCSQVKILRNTMITFLVSGLWHGANWTFIIWGGYHGLLVYGYRKIKPFLPTQSNSRLLNNARKYLSILLLFVLCTIGWMVFRCDTFQQFFGMLERFSAPGGLFFSWALTAIIPICIMLFKELKDEEGWNIHLLHSKNWILQAVSIALLIVYVFYTGELNGAQFIYFQF